MMEILIGVSVIALLVGLGFYVNYLEDIEQERKRLEKFNRDEHEHEDEVYRNFLDKWSGGDGLDL